MRHYGGAPPRRVSMAVAPECEVECVKWMSSFGRKLKPSFLLAAMATTFEGVVLSVGGVI